MFAPWAAALVDLLVECVVKSMLLIAVVGVVLWALRVTDANLRHRTWTVVLLTMLALPALGWMLPAIEVPGWLSLPTSEIAQVEATHLPVDVSGPVLSEQVSPQVMPILATAAESTAASTLPVTESRTATQESPAKVEHTGAPVLETSISWQSAVAVVYLAVAAVLIVRLGLGMALTWRMMRRGRRLTDADHAAFAGQHIIVQSSDVRTPATVGIWHPTILLPCDWGSWSDSAVELAIAHELSHVRRRDALTTLLANGNAAVYWFHPLAWWLRRKLADLAEQVCDDEVLRTHGDRACYAETLLTMASRLTGQERVSPLLVPMARQAQVEMRIEAIIDYERPLCRRMGWLGAILLMVIAAPVVALIAAAQQAQTAEAVNDPLIVGSVVDDATGKPIAGATVRLMGWTTNRMEYDLRTAVTDREGRFQFFELPGGRLQLIAFHGDLSSRTKRFEGFEITTREESIELRMKRVPSLQVKIVDEATGLPLAGAKVHLGWFDGESDHFANKDGEVLIGGLTPELWTINVFAKEHAELEEAVQLPDTGTTAIAVALDPGFEVAGRVVDEQGEPVAGIAVSANPTGDYSRRFESTRTDREGMYRLSYLPLIGLQIGFSKDGFLDEDLELVPDVASGETQELNAALARRPRGGSVIGTVVNAKSEPIIGAHVINRGRSSADARETLTDADGRYRLDDVVAGVEGHMLVVKSSGYVPGIAKFSPGTNQAPGRADVTLERGHRLRGQVVNEHGVPLEGIYVGYQGQAALELGLIDDGSYVVTGPNGKFQFDTLPADVRFDIRSYNTAGKFSTLHEHKLPLDREEEVVVTLPPEGVMRGRVVDAATGKPLPTFVANVTFSPDRTNDDPNGTLFGPRSTGEGETFSSPQGEFRMGSFAQGMPLQVTIEADGYERAVVRRVVARRESEAESVEFRLLPIEKGELVSFAGRVVDQAGKGVSGIELRLIVSSERRAIPRDKFPFNWEMVRSGGLGKVAEVKQFLSATTNREGRFEFRNVMPGADMELAWWGSGVSQDRMPRLEKLDEADRQNLRIEITATGIVVGKFNRERFRDVNDVALSGNGDFFRGRLNGKDATYRIENVPPGRYELQLYRRVPVVGERFRKTEVLHRLPVEVESGETTVVDFGATNEESAERGGEGTTKDANDTNAEANAVGAEEKLAVVGDTEPYSVVYPLDDRLKGIDLPVDITYIKKDGKEMALVIGSRKSHEKIGKLLQGKSAEEQTTKSANDAKEEVNAEGAKSAEKYEGDDVASRRYMILYPLDEIDADIKSWLKAIELASEVRLTTKDGKDVAVVIGTREEHERVSTLLQTKRAESKNSRFPTLEEQRAADLAYKLLGVELEMLSPEELTRVKAKGYQGGLRVAAISGRQTIRGDLAKDDLLVGLHVWPTESLKQVQEILVRYDVPELTPLKYYVIHTDYGGKEQFSGDSKGKDEVVTGRIEVDLTAWAEKEGFKQQRLKDWKWVDDSIEGPADLDPGQSRETPISNRGGYQNVLPPSTNRYGVPVPTDAQGLRVVVAPFNKKPIAGSRNAYQFFVTNAPNRAGESVELSVTFPSNLVPDMATIKAPVAAQLVGDEVRFHPIAMLRANERLSIQITANVLKAGDGEIVAKIKSKDSPEKEVRQAVMVVDK